MVGKKWRSSLPAKVAAFLLAVLLFISGTVLVGGTVVLLHWAARPAPRRRRRRLSVRCCWGRHMKIIHLK